MKIKVDMKPTNLRLILLAFVHFFYTGFAHAQSGDYFISNWTPEGLADPTQTFELLQRDDGLIVAANKNGLLLFDGSEWETFRTPGTPLSITQSVDGIWAVGAYGISFHPHSKMAEFQLIADDSLINSAKQIISTSGKIFVLQDDQVNVFDKEEKQLLFTYTHDRPVFKSIFIIDDKPFITTQTSVFELQENELSGKHNLPVHDIIYGSSIDDKSLLVTSKAEIYSKSGGEWTKLSYNSDNYENILDGISATNAVLSNGLLGITTLTSGILIVDTKEQKLAKVINHHNGLPDNDIAFISADYEGGMWVGHAEGISRLAPYLPIRDFTYYPGLEGKILNAHYYQNQLFVGTTEGLFKLEKVQNYDQVVRYIETQKEVKKETTDKKGIFSFFKKRKKEEETKTVTEVEKIVSRELKSIRWIYQKVTDIEGKVSKILVKDNALIVSSSDGLYLLEKGNISKISDQPVTDIWLGTKSPILFANTYNSNLKTYTKQAGGWIEEEFFSGFEADVFDVYQDSRGRIWFVTASEIFFVTYENNGFYLGKDFKYNNPFQDKVIISENEEGLTFRSRVKNWVFDQEEEIVRELENKVSATRYLKGGSDIWYLNDNSEWQKFGENDYHNKVLNAFSDASFINDKTESAGLYVISKDHLYQVSVDSENLNLTSPYELTLKSVEGMDENLRNNFRLVERSESLIFHYVKPDYTGLFPSKYSYRIKGFKDDWTEFDENNRRVPLNYLPEGNYELEVRASTALEENAETDPVVFEVVPPYWKRPWFYAFEFTILLWLLILSIYLNRNARKYRIFNRLLAFLVLIMIIEFIQVLAESYFETGISPFVGFFIQVGVAFLILPVESFLRGMITEDKKLKLPVFPRSLRK